MIDVVLGGGVAAKDWQVGTAELFFIDQAEGDAPAVSKDAIAEDAGGDATPIADHPVQRQNA